MKKVLEIGGFIAGAVLIVFGVAVIALAINGRSTVNSSLTQEKIVGTPDMTPAGIKTEAQQAGLTTISFPSCSVAGKAIDSGSTARCFAQYMRIHALEATGGLTYAQMGRYATAGGKPIGTNDATKAVQQNGQPVANAARDVWVTETALTTALNMSYMASAALALQHRRRRRTPAHRLRVRDPRLGGAPQAARGDGGRGVGHTAADRQAGDRLRLPAWKPGKGGARSNPRPHHCQGERERQPDPPERLVRGAANGVIQNASRSSHSGPKARPGSRSARGGARSSAARRSRTEQRRPGEAAKRARPRARARDHRGGAGASRGRRRSCRVPRRAASCASRRQALAHLFPYCRSSPGTTSACERWLRRSSRLLNRSRSARRRGATRSGSSTRPRCRAGQSRETASAPRSPARPATATARATAATSGASGSTAVRRRRHADRLRAGRRERPGTRRRAPRC